MFRKLALVLCVLSGPCLAQPKHAVSPPALDNIYTGLHNGIPFGGYQSVEQLYQQVDEGLMGRVLLIDGLAFAHTWSSDYGSRRYTMSVKIGDAATTAATISDTFTQNFVGTPTTVRSGTVDWPVRSRGFTLPGPFDSPILFSVPFPYTGINPICWEAYISADNGYTTGASTHYFMAGTADTAKRPKYWAGTIGAGCVAPGRNPLVDRPLTSHAYVDANAPRYYEYLTFGPASSPVSLHLGLPSNTYAGLPLPLNLGFLGAPASCNLFISPIIQVIAGVTDATGRFELNLPFAFGAATTGLQFRTQWVAFDTNKTMITSVSNGLNHLVPFDGANKVWQVSRNWGTTFGTALPVKSTGRPNGSNGQRSGLNEPFYGLITEWRHL